MAASMELMRYCFLKLICGVFILTYLVDGQYSLDHRDLTSKFKDFMIKYNRSYFSNETEYTKRFHNFKQNLENAEVLNRDYDRTSAVYGINKFSDLSPEEFNEKYLSGHRPPTSLKFQSSFSSSETKSLNLTGLPKKVDWRSKGVVTDIKNQESCGACWAFTVTEVMESMLTIQYGFKLQTLSVQELIDCDTLEAGCRGGDICSATRWASRYGVVEEKYYPLKDKTESCKPISDLLPRTRVHSYACKRYVNKEQGILSLLTRGPVAVAVDGKTFHSYTQGIIQYHCPSFINHAVVIVGYDLTGDVPYYIARNSWGKDFGDDGYLYIRIGHNLCGIATEVVFLTVDMPA